MTEFVFTRGRITLDSFNTVPHLSGRGVLDASIGRSRPERAKDSPHFLARASGQRIVVANGKNSNVETSHDCARRSIRRRARRRKPPIDRLAAFLRPHFPNASGPLVVEQFPHGHSNLTYLLRLGNQELVLRRPPFGNQVKSAHDMSREYRVPSKLSAVYARRSRISTAMTRAC